MMKCEIIRDLIPLYLDKVCSEDSRKLVEEHLAECSECRKYMKELETELEAVKQKKEEDLDEKRLLQEGAERMKEIGKKSIVDKMIIVDTLLNFLLIVTAVVLLPLIPALFNRVSPPFGRMRKDTTPSSAME